MNITKGKEEACDRPTLSLFERMGLAGFYVGLAYRALVHGVVSTVSAGEHDECTCGGNCAKRIGNDEEE